MGSTIEDQIAELGRMTVTELRPKYLEVFGEETRSNNKQFLYRRIAWRIQATFPVTPLPKHLSRIG